MDERDEMHRLIAGLRAGDPRAADEFYDRYGPAVRAIVRRELHHRLRARFDSLDFVQDVWVSFLARPAERDAFESPQALLGFLIRVARNKVIEAFRQRFRTQKHAIARERPQAPAGGADEPPGAAPSPSQVAVAGEAWARLLSQVPPGHRAIVERLREGHTHEEIARLTRVSVSTVSRIVRRLKDVTNC